MYIDAFWAGVGATIVVELLALIVAAVVKSGKMNR